MLEDIRFRLNDSEHVYFCATEEETRFMLSLIDKYKNTLEEIREMTPYQIYIDMIDSALEKE